MAKKKAEFVSISSVDKILKEYATEQYEYLDVKVGNSVVRIKVQKHLALPDEIACINGITEAVFVDGEYHAELYEAAKVMHFVASYTNIKVECGIDRMYELKFGTNVIRDVLSMIDACQWGSICRAADAAIAYRVNSIQEKQKYDLETLSQKLSQSINLLSKMSSSFESVNPELVSQAMERLARVDEQKIIDIVAERQAREE